MLAIVWGVLWAPFGVLLVLALAAARFPISWRDALSLVAQGAVAGAVWGLVSGVLFSLALGAAERRGAVEKLAGRRVILWGALSGVMFPAVMIAVIMWRQRVGLDEVVGPFLLTGTGAVYGAIVGGLLLSAARRGTAAPAA